jgi:predicted phosphoribosyltransferase
VTVFLDRRAAGLALGALPDIVLVRKVGMPGNAELALGAIVGPGGETMVLNEDLVGLYHIDPATIEAQAAPVAPPEVVSLMAGLADRVVCLHMPDDFRAVGLHYAHFPQLEDDEVRRILAGAHKT